MLKALMKFIFCILLISQSYLLFANKDVKTISEKDFAPHVQDIDRIVQKINSDCEKDNSSEKDARLEKICTDLADNEKYLTSSYNKLIDACVYRTMSRHLEIKGAYYDQQFVDSLSKQGKLRLLRSKNPEDLEHLKLMEDKFMNDITNKLFPSFREDCKKNITYESHRKQFLKLALEKFYSEQNNVKFK